MADPVIKVTTRYKGKKAQGDASAAVRDFQRLPEVIQKMVPRYLDWAVNLVEAEVTHRHSDDTKGPSPVGFLHAPTGGLRKKITSKVDENRGFGIVGTSSKDPSIAAVHEFGAVIRPKTAKYLHFSFEDRITGEMKWARVKKVVIPARAPFGEAMKAKRKELREGLSTFMSEMANEEFGGS